MPTLLATTSTAGSDSARRLAPRQGARSSRWVAAMSSRREQSGWIDVGGDRCGQPERLAWPDDRALGVRLSLELVQPQHARLRVDQQIPRDASLGVVELFDHLVGVRI